MARHLSATALVLFAVTIFLGNVQEILAKRRKVCGMPADISLVLDSSGSIYPPAFNDQLMPFLKDLVQTFEVSPEKVRFSLLTYSAGVNRQFTFNFNEYPDETSLLARLDTVKWVWGGSTRTDLAVQYARREFFSTARDNVEKIEIIVTDGKADDNKKLAKEIAATKKKGITIFAVGVGDAVSMGDLLMMASEPRYVFNVTSYKALDEIIDVLAATACIQPTTVPKTQPCGNRLPDIMFTMDASRMNIEDVTVIFDFMIDVIKQESLDYEGMRVGLLTGKCYNYRDFYLGEFNDKVNLGNYLDKLIQADMVPLIKELRTKSFLPERGGRPGARRVAVVTVPEKVVDLKGFLNEINEAKRQKVEIFAVGVGKMADSKLLNTIASSRRNVLRLSSSLSTTDMTTRATEFVEALCESGFTEPPVTVKPSPRPSAWPTPKPTLKPGC